MTGPLCEEKQHFSTIQTTNNMSPKFHIGKLENQTQHNNYYSVCKNIVLILNHIMRLTYR